MADQPLNRRDFLRLSLVLAGSALASCQGIVPGSTPTDAKGNMPKSAFQLNGGDADAWSYDKLIKGFLKDPSACRAVWIDNGRADSARVQATLDGQAFSASVPTQPGSNSLKAVCQKAD